MTIPPDRQPKPDLPITASPPAAGDAALSPDVAEQRIHDLLAALSRATAAYEALLQENVSVKQENETLQQENETLHQEDESVKQENELLRQVLERYRRYVYGRRSERLDDP